MEQYITGVVIPIASTIIGGFIVFTTSRKLERNKIEMLKEKEWQLKWAELLFSHSSELNNNIAKLMTTLACYQEEIEEIKKIDKNKENEMRAESLLNECYLYARNISELDWKVKTDIQIVADEYKNPVIKTQFELMENARSMVSKGKGDFEKMRSFQYKYNDAVRKAHSEMLKFNKTYSPFQI